MKIRSSDFVVIASKDGEITIALPANLNPNEMLPDRVSALLIAASMLQNDEKFVQEILQRGRPQ